MVVGVQAVFIILQRCGILDLREFFLILTLFFNLILNLTLSVFLKLTLLAAPIALARPNACAAPCMVARQRADVAATGFADR